MKTPILTSLPLIAMALACGTPVLARPAATARTALTVRVPQGQVPQGRIPPGKGLRGRSSPLHVVETNQDDMDLRMSPVVKAVRRAADSVVSIYVIHESRLTERGAMRADGQGSGVILDENGLVITNWHVASRAAERGSPFRLRVRLKNNKIYPADVLSTSARYDLALLQMNLPRKEKVKPIDIGSSSSLMVGETVIAIGNPQGHANTVTVGVLSAENRRIQVRAPDGTMRQYSGLLQTDAAINQGNSGGALLDITGKLIGINNAMAVGVENIGFAIPVDVVRHVFQDVLLSSDNLATVWLGMKVQDQAGHVVVTEVDPYGPAARAGVQPGDRVLEANDQAIASSLDYARRTLRARPGVRFPLRLARQGRKLRIGAIPLGRGAAEILHRAGIVVEEVTPRQDASLVRRATQELYAGTSYRRVPLLPRVLRVTSVVPDSPGGQLELRQGDVLLGLVQDSFFGSRNLPFTSTNDMADKLRAYAGREAWLLVLRGKEGLTGPLELPR